MANRVLAGVLCGGLSTALLGLALHLAILVVVAWIYLLAAQRSPTMQRH